MLVLDVHTHTISQVLFDDFDISKKCSFIH